MSIENSVGVEVIESYGQLVVLTSVKKEALLFDSLQEAKESLEHRSYRTRDVAYTNVLIGGLVLAGGLGLVANGLSSKDPLTQAKDITTGSLMVSSSFAVFKYASSQFKERNNVIAQLKELKKSIKSKINS